MTHRSLPQTLPPSRQRVRELGAEHCYVGTGSGRAANRFYGAVGFKVIRTGWFWVKEM